MRQSPGWEDLPIQSVLPELVDRLAGHPYAVVVAPPGAGKTLGVPGALKDSRWIRPGDAVWVLEPRRLAARMAATRLASLRGGRLGAEVGYQVRQDSALSADTRILFLTDGLARRRIVQDPSLEGVGVVILDEFHERSLDMDLCLAFLREVQRSLRPDLRVVIMSATLETDALARFLDDCPVLTTTGRTFPLEIRYLAQRDERSFEDRMISGVRRAVRASESDSGDILAFLPGGEEIRRVEKSLRDGLPDDVVVMTLFGGLSRKEQLRVFEPSRKRKVVLATNIAESSLTVPGVSTVVDGGVVKRIRQDLGTGLDRLEWGRVSRQSADQRAGRAGRERPGVAYRLWTESEQAFLPLKETPAILREDLASLALAVADWSSQDPRLFGWFEAPKDAALTRAEELLRDLGAFEPGSFRLSESGRFLAEAPFHPRLGQLLFVAKQMGLPGLGAKLAAILSEEELLVGDRPRYAGGCDVALRLDAYDAWVERGANTRAASQLGLDAPVCGRVHDQVKRFGSEHNDRSNRASEPRETSIARLMLSVFPDRVGKKLEGKHTYALASGGSATLGSRSAVGSASWLVAVRLESQAKAEGTRATIRWASEVTPEDLARQKGLVQSSESLEFDRGKERIVSVRLDKVHALVLRERSTVSEPTEAAAHLLEVEAGKNLERALPMTEAFEHWLGRLRFLRFADPALALPEWSVDPRRELLSELCFGRSSFGALRAIDLPEYCSQRLPGAVRSRLAQDAPDVFVVPSGKKLRLRYGGDGPPVLAARIQDLFGLLETPRLGQARIPIRIELLAPNRRPVQVTQDLGSFWRETYQEVRKALRGRYPKHAWPEDPFHPGSMNGRGSHKTR
jgi:ATP-dependent helicase HrpB